MEIKVKVNSKAKEIKEEFDKQIELDLLAIGENSEGFAKEDCHVDTGRLRNDINYAVIVPEKTVLIGTNVEYVVYVEFNDHARHETGKAHFLRDAATTHSELYKEITRAALVD